MDFIYTILWPIEWLVELIMIGWHWLFMTLGLPSDSGVIWVLSIMGLTVVVRAALVPLFVKTIKNQRRMLEVAPQLKKIQEKYKGKKDQFSREAMSRETMALYKETGTNPLSSCLPILIQMPFFFSLYHMVTTAAMGQDTVGLLSHFDLAKSFANARFFGAPLKDSFGSQWGEMVAGKPFNLSVMIIAAVMIILMTASQFITQRQMLSKNMSEETKNSPQFKQQRQLMYFLPFIFLFSGVFFPLAPMFYYIASNFWMMGQQYMVIRNMPTPGSEAEKTRNERLARKGKLRAPDGAAVLVVDEVPAKPINTQRQQPMSKARAKKSGGKKQ
jgi:YidC/Oxa1 family membrane protein insertase